MENKFFLNLVKRTFPSLKRGALYISDSDLRTVLFEKGKLLGISVHLPKGVIEDGQIKNDRKLLAALKQLHNSLIDFQTKVELIVCLPPQIIYNYYFTVPPLSPEEISQAAYLNLKMKSPQPYAETYGDWQVIEETDEEVEILGAYANKNTVNKFSLLLYQANFLPVAFEFQGLALARLLRDFDPELIKIPFLLLYISNQGLNLSFIKDGNLYFDYFVPWSKKQFELKEFERIIKEEIQKVLTFCRINLKESFSKIFLISSLEESNIKKFIEREMSLEVVIYRIEKYSISPIWYVSLGSLLKNMEYPSHFLNLAGEELQTEIRKESVRNLGVFWRNTVISFLSLFLLVVLSFNLFLLKYDRSLKSQFQSIILPIKTSEVKTLKSKAENFNKLIKMVSEVKRNKNRYADKISKLVGLTERKITLNYLSIFGNSIRIQGETSDEKEIVDFKNRLIKAGFKNVNLPLSEIKPFRGKTKFVLNCEIAR